MKKYLGAIVLASVLAVSGPAVAAFAAEGDGDSYTPTTPTVPTLAGSSVSSSCVKDVPYINFSVVMTDPDNVATSHEAFLYLSDSNGNSANIPLGTLVNDKLSGSILWPGAATDGGGHATSWPGWANVNGAWVTTTGNYAWTRGNITAEIRVNPDLVVALSYPHATALCADPASTPTPETAGLASTGGSIPWIAAGVGAGALAVGAGLLVRRRRANR